MANVMRKVWDARANPAHVLEYSVASATAISIGDLLWLDSTPQGGVSSLFLGTVKPASSTDLWTGTLAGTLGKLADKFVGVALSAHAANDTKVTTVTVMTKGVFHFACTSSAFEIGDLVAGVRDGSNNYLLAQSVQRVARGAITGALTESMAIGKVAKRAATAVTEVQVEILSSAVAGGGVRAFLGS